MHAIIQKRIHSEEVHHNSSRSLRNIALLRMSLTEQIEQFASRFRDDDATLQSRYSTLSELYDIMELLNSPEDYHFFLQAVVPLLLNN